MGVDVLNSTSLLSVLAGACECVRVLAGVRVYVCVLNGTSPPAQTASRCRCVQLKKKAEEGVS